MNKSVSAMLMLRGRHNNNNNNIAIKQDGGHDGVILVRIRLILWQMDAEKLIYIRNVLRL